MLMPGEVFGEGLDLAPVVVMPGASIGDVPWVNGEDAQGCPDYVPTRHELEVLARHWLQAELDVIRWFEETGCSGSTEWRTRVYANQRLARLEQVLGHETLDRIVDEVGEAWERQTARN
jgi:hypothetical protein